MLRKIFEPERDESSGAFRILHYKKFLNLYRPHSIIRAVKSRRL